MNTAGELGFVVLGDGGGGGVVLRSYSEQNAAAGTSRFVATPRAIRCAGIGT